MNDDTRAWVLGWFRRRAVGKDLQWEVDAGTNYYEAGWIDSFAAVELLEELEQAFRIKLSDDDMADAGFATMSGLVAIIDRRRGG
jgi:acyl carrier protein